MATQRADAAATHTRDDHALRDDHAVPGCLRNGNGNGNVTAPTANCVIVAGREDGTTSPARWPPGTPKGRPRGADRPFVEAQVDQLFCASHRKVAERLVFCRSSSAFWVGAPVSPMSGSQYVTLYVIVLGVATEDAGAAQGVLLGPGYVDEKDVSAVRSESTVWPVDVPDVR